MTRKAPRNPIKAIVCTALVAACGLAPDAPEDSVVTISVVGTNDVHGALQPNERSAGLARFAGYLNNLRAARTADGGAVVLLDAGDMWQGTLESNLSEGATVVDVYNALAYDAAAIGNHEFDFGPAGPRSTPASAADDARGALKMRVAEAHFPVLAANLMDEQSGRPVNWLNVSPSTLLSVNGIDVGIVGGMTEHALAVTIALNVHGLRVAPLAPAIEREARALRDAGADIVLVTVHAGGECLAFDEPHDLSTCRLDAELFRVAYALPQGLVDVIVGGHVHEGIAHVVNGIAVISSYSRTAAFGRVDLFFDRDKQRLVDKHLFEPQSMLDATQVYAGVPVVPDQAIQSIIDEATTHVNAIKNRSLGVTLSTPMARADIPESSLGNMLADIMLASSKSADIAIHNTMGGIRADLAAGPLTYGEIYEVFPFDNRLVHLTLSGGELRRVFEEQFTGRSWLAGLAGLQVAAACGDTGIRVTLRRPDGTLVEDDDEIVIATTNFLATGGDNVFKPVMPDGGFELDPDAPLFRDELTAWLEARGGTLGAADFYDPDTPRFRLPTALPMKCNAG